MKWRSCLAYPGLFSETPAGFFYGVGRLVNLGREKTKNTRARLLSPFPLSSAAEERMKNGDV
jgi:hypothetical protein